MRKKDEEWPRTGTFCAAWGRISVMQWPIFTGHFEPLRLLPNWSGLTIRPLICAHVYENDDGVNALMSGGFSIMGKKVKVRRPWSPGRPAELFTSRHMLPRDVPT